MAFWSSEKMRHRLTPGDIVTPYDHGRIKHGSYELALGPEAYITAQDSRKKEILSQDAHLVIPPGQFGLLLTEEVVSTPKDTLGFISIRASVKFRGLVNVSGFHVDPGFVGRLKFSVYNAGSQDIVLSRGERVFMIWFADLDRETSDGYGGQRLGQNEITSQDVMRMQGEVASPSQLRKEIQELQHSVNNVKILLTILISVAVSIFLNSLRPILQPVTQPSSTQQQTPTITQSEIHERSNPLPATQSATPPTPNTSLPSPKAP